MFDFGFWELSLIGVLALVILGPERLPVVARTLGGWVRRGRRFVRNFGEEISGDTSVTELRQEVRRMRSEIEGETRHAMDEIDRMGRGDDLNGSQASTQINDSSESEQPPSAYEFGLDDVDSAPGTDGDAQSATTADASRNHESVDESVLTHHESEDAEALYARARQHYFQSDADSAGDEPDDQFATADDIRHADRE
ncbi:twin-arginine translocase subunit TatB [Salinisphaera sp. USBA-960]|uniref:Sec-independent protein translocase protein TatB n=1 Tax=Salinisphaera orenii TaxID=856731 RepID=UPI000DBE6658|nr:twin-arginine translocase subunit TatB [Salifodinibacter halophilus]NNC25494.1 twin-arginine translocase subunit TatB [Salifodinibacter halophilus]